MLCAVLRYYGNTSHKKKRFLSGIAQITQKPFLHKVVHVEISALPSFGSVTIICNDSKYFHWKQSLVNLLCIAISANLKQLCCLIHEQWNWSPMYQKVVFSRLFSFPVFLGESGIRANLSWLSPVCSWEKLWFLSQNHHFINMTCRDKRLTRKAKEEMLIAHLAAEWRSCLIWLPALWFGTAIIIIISIRACNHLHHYHHHQY